jgi:biotin carboxyl carrier protein
MDFEIKVGDQLHRVSVANRDQTCVVQHKDKEWEVRFSPIADGLFRLEVGTRIHRVHLVEKDGKSHLSVLGHQFCVERCESRRTRSAEPGRIEEHGAVCPPMPGMVVKLNVAEGDLVKKNQSLAIVEAMKMENELRSPVDGRVKKINGAPGDLVDAGTPLIELEAS